MDRRQPRASPDDIDIFDLWRAVARARLPLLVLVLLAGAGTYAVVSQLTPSYKSESQLLLETPNDAFTRPKGQEGVSEAQKLDQDIMASEVQVVSSRDLLAKVAKDLVLDREPEFNAGLKVPGLIDQLGGLLGMGGIDLRRSEEDRVLDALEQRLVVYPISRSYVIVVEVASANPELAAKIANAIADGYIEFGELGRLRDGNDAITWLGGQLESLKKDASEAEVALERFRANSGLLSGQNNVTLNTQQLTELNTQLTQAQALTSDAEARARLIRQLMASGDLTSSPELSKSSLMSRLTEQKSELDRQIAELSATLLPKHPRMRQLGSELASLKKQIRAEAANVVRSIEGEADVARARQASIEKSIAQLSKVAGDSSESQAQLRVLEREATSKRELYETFLNRFNDASTRRDRLAVPASAKVIARARPASEPDFPKKLPLTMLAMAATLLAGLGFVISRALLVGARSGLARQPRPRGRVPAVATMENPYRDDALTASRSRTANIDNAPRQTREPTSPTGAAHPIRFDAASGIARYLAMRGTSRSGYRTLITSDEPTQSLASEAVELGRSLSATGAQVMLIDWTFRGATAASLAGLKRTPGMADLVAGRATFETVVQRDRASTLQLIAGGVEAPVFDDDLADNLRLVLEALDEAYQHIVIVADRADAEILLETLDGRIDAGVLLVEGTGHDAGPAAGFIGFEVPGLDLIRLDKRIEAGVRSLRRAVPARHAVAE